MLSDILKPDNPKRKERAQQLLNDCYNFEHEVKNEGEIIDKLNSDLIKVCENLNLKNNYFSPKDLEIETGETKKTKIIVSSFVLGGILGTLGAKIITKTIHNAIVAKLYYAGKIGPAAFVKLVGYPKWYMGFGKFTGGFVGGIAIGVAIDLIVSSVNSSAEKEKSRNAIHSLIGPRKNLKHLVMQTKMVSQYLQACIMTLDAVKTLGEQVIQTTIESLTKNAQQKIEMIQVNNAIDDLNNLDASRNSWTREDYN